MTCSGSLHGYADIAGSGRMVVTGDFNSVRRSEREPQVTTSHARLLAAFDDLVHFNWEPERRLQELRRYVADSSSIESKQLEVGDQHSTSLLPTVGGASSTLSWALLAQQCAACRSATFTFAVAVPIRRHTVVHTQTPPRCGGLKLTARGNVHDTSSS
jgi:hypothetical protein